MERYETHSFYQRLFIEKHNLQNWKKQKVLLTFDEYHNNTEKFITIDFYHKFVSRCEIIIHIFPTFIKMGNITKHKVAMFCDIY